jgi:Cysteine-rich secretory protein family
LRRCCLLVACLVALVLADPLGGSARADAAVQRSDLASAFVAQINGDRVSAGRPRLAISSALVSVASGWAEQMARSNVLAHNARLASAVHGWHYLGENVGVGYSTSSLEGAFWASPEHRSNMVDPDYTELGVAVVDVGGKLWVVEDFERPASAQPAATAHASGHRAARPSTARSAPRPRPTRSAGRPAGTIAVGSTWPATLARACAAQALRLYADRRSPIHGFQWALLRQDLNNGRRAGLPG